MSVIKNSPKLEPNSNQPPGEPDKVENVENKLKRSNTQIAPAQSNSISSNRQSRRGSLKRNKQLSNFERNQSLSPKDFKSMDSGDATESAVYKEEEDDQTTSENKAGPKIPQKQRSKSGIAPNIVSLKSITKLFPSFNLDRLRMAREITEKAIKTNKIFTIQGGYATVRNCLRKRGWVENFFRATEIVKKPAPKTKSDVFSSDDDYDDDDDGIDAEVDVPKVKPWEEEDGLYGIMSRMVRNLPPAFFWILRRDLVDYRTLNKTQMVNHFARSAVFTTKVGLCVNLRNLQWFDETDPNTFFPRCYRLSHEEEKHEFIDDFNFTACMNILKIVVENYMDWSTLSLQERQKSIISAKSNTESEKQMEIINEKNTDGKNTPKKEPYVPALAVIQALKQCELFIDRKENMDVDMDEQELGYLTNSQWDKLREWYYLLVHNNSIIVDLPATLVNQCEASLKRLQILCPQFYLDGKNSVWIVKPGAKSRGRGITCYDRLEEILKLVDSNVAKRESKYVIQKYIERPLLIYNCKFDIRQWFLVTDWNPLTMWFYRDSYLRFCSQQFTLSKFDESIHLCNNAVQKNYKNGPRAKELPENNMWTHHQFQEYLRNRSLPNIWDELIYPGMKKAVICSMFVSQELIEPRKGSFELYGADFMLTDDYSPWLIEINSSPSMEASTEVTSRLCTKVLEDTIKVVLDRKHDKNCDIGRFEIGYKQSTVNSPPYLCMNMSIEGQAIKRQCPIKRSVDLSQDTKENVLPTSQQPKKPSGPQSQKNMDKENTNDCKEVIPENSKLAAPPCNGLIRKKAVMSVTNKKLVKSQTCSTYTLPNDSLMPHAEKLKTWSTKVLEISSVSNNNSSWMLDKEDATKNNKKVDPKVQKGNKIIGYPNGRSYSPKSYQIPSIETQKLKANIKSYQIPSIETQKLKANIKSFHEFPKKTLVTPIARIKFPLLTLQLSKQPHMWRFNPQKQI